MTQPVLFHRLHPHALLPKRAHDTDAGWDVCAVEGGVIEPGTYTSVMTGLAMELPVGTCCWVLPRSGLAARHGIGIVNAPGLIDADYRGEVGVLLINHGKDPFVYEAGERIAQLVVQPVLAINMQWAENEISETMRGTGGFGSTGR